MMASRPWGREGSFGSGIDAVSRRTGSASIQFPFLCRRLDFNHDSAQSHHVSQAMDMVVGKDQRSRAKRAINEI
jgi:hypothetical protein